jgi:hypothetical protein
MQESHCPTGIAVKKTDVEAIRQNYRKQAKRLIFRQLAKDRLRRGTDPGYGYDFSELQDPDQAQRFQIKSQMKTLYIQKNG